MVKVFSPLMSLDASGTIGDAITFSKWKGRNYVRKRVIPNNPHSPLQTGMRAGLAFLSRFWGNLTQGEKAAWQAFYASEAISGINAYVRFNQRRIRQNKGPMNLPTAVEAAMVAAPGAFAATPQPKSISLIWVPSGGIDVIGTAIFRKTAADPTLDVSELIHISDDLNPTYVDPRLTVGVNYHYKAAAVTSTGSYGVATAVEIAAPTA